MKQEAAWNALRRETRVRLVAGIAGPRRLFLVGGCLRDAALGIASKDLDLVVERDALAIAERYAEAPGATIVRLGGDRFAAIRLVDAAGWIDLLDLGDTTLEKDLLRRDLTVNAIAVDVENGAVHDPAGGRADLERRLLRATRPSVFTEDPLRTLRLARLALTLPAFTIDPETEGLARESMKQLTDMARERIREELDRILAHPDLARAIALLDRLGLLAILFGDANARRLTAGTSTKALAAAKNARPQATAVQRLPLYWSFLSAVENASPDATREFLAGAHRTGLLTKSTLDRARTLVQAGWRVPETEAETRRWLHQAGETWREAARLRATLAENADVRASWEQLERRTEQLDIEQLRAILDPPPLLDGVEIQGLLGIGEGRAVGEALAAIRRAQVEGTVKTRGEAEALLRARN